MCYSPLIRLRAFFSNLETCACDIPTSFATSICVLPCIKRRYIILRSLSSSFLISSLIEISKPSPCLYLFPKSNLQRHFSAFFVIIRCRFRCRDSSASDPSTYARSVNPLDRRHIFQSKCDLIFINTILLISLPALLPFRQMHLSNKFS